MTLRELIAGADLDPGDAPGIEIADLAYRSESVTPGALFFCVRGFTSDGHEFAADAVEHGAVALVCERGLSLGVPEVIVPNVRAAMAPIAARFYGEPSRELRIVGITGTNGKTTTTFLVRQVLETAGVHTGLLGTVWSVVGGEIEPVERTTPEAIDLQCAFRRMLDAGDQVCVMEVSSHALELHRADATTFACAVFTNLTRDHLDFHASLDDYFGAKRSLFVSGVGPHPRCAVINVDDQWGERLAAEVAESSPATLVTFAVDRDADYRARDVASNASGVHFSCEAPSGAFEVSLPLPGLFNVYNALAAIGVAGALGIDTDPAVAALAQAERVPGRFESIDEGQQFTVLVDYAHTPDSLEGALRSARELLDDRDGRLICVFGAGGDRDTDKRPLMGEVARRLSDHVVVTSDNPRSEDPEVIIAAIVGGAERTGGDSVLEVEVDRKVAIKRALVLARAGDVVVIAGKGHERGQEFEAGRKVPFDDREVARATLRPLTGDSARPAA